MPEAFYDIVVVGTGISGLAYGALCAKQGYTVLVVGQDARPATWTAGPAVLFRRLPIFYGFNTSLSVRSFFRDIGLIAEMRNRPQKLEPNLQIVTPGVRVTLSEHFEAVQEELRRAFPDSSNELEKFLRSVPRDSKEMDEFLDELPMLPPDGFWARYKLKRYIARHVGFALAMEPVLFPSEMRFSSPLTSLLLFMTRVHSKPLSPFAVRRMLQHLMGGFFEFPQGIDGLKRLFTERIVANGGAYWPERSVEQVLLKGKKKVESVAVVRPRRAVGCRMLVANCPARTLLSLIPQEQQNPTFHGAIKAIKPALYNYVVNFAVRPDVLPEGMGRNVMLSMYPKQAMSGPGVLWVYTRRPEPHETDGLATLAVQCRLDTRELPLEKPGFDALNERILHSLEWVVPFVRDKLVQVQTPYLAVERDTEQERLDPAEVQEVYDTPYPGTLELSALPGLSKYKNLLLLGEHYLGALGLEGEILAARQAFAWTRERIVLKQVLEKK